MLLRFAVGLLITSIAMAAVLAGRGDATSAQNSVAKNTAELVPAPENSSPPVKPINPLPITQVVLFNSGVGYFHRSGQVEGDARVDLQFQASDINDLIKSLVIEDSQGKVLPLRYDSQEPIEKTLRSFAINLSSNPTFGQILNQARGEKVELTLIANNAGLPGTLSGTIIGMESAHRLPTPTSTATAEMEFVNLMCAEGLRTVPVNQIQRLRFLNPAIENELRRALDVVAGGHDSQKKAVRIGFRGEGRRDVKVGYVTENPIWKTSYRVVLDKNGKAKLLGWANVENTSDEDWQNVKLSLVSGRPISFQMDLYPPLFIPRPTVEPELFASLRPPTYSGPITGLTSLGQFGQTGGGFNFGLNGSGFSFAGGGFGGGGFGNANLSNTAPTQQAAAPMSQTNALNNNWGMGQNGMPSGLAMNPNALGLNRYQNVDAANLAANSKLTFKDLQNRRNDAKGQQNHQEAQQQAKQIGNILTNVDPELIEAAMTAEELGNPARFVIEERVSLPRQQSAMIPILEQPIDTTRVSIYNQRVQAKHPLFGLKIKNNSKQSLMQGPIAVYDDDQYSGDARILDLQPGEERFISYAIDIGTEVIPFDKVVPAPEMTARMENGQLHVEYKLRTTRSYLIKNRSNETRKIVIEQPVRDGWKFTEARKNTQTEPGEKDADGMEKEAKWKAGDVEKPSERTRDLYRFTVDVKAGETVKYEVSEELPRIDPFASTRQADWTGFATTLGLDVSTDTRRTPEDLFGIEVESGGLKVTHKDRRTTTYTVKNRADVERLVWLEHFVPKGRTLVADARPDGEERRRYRFKLVMPPNKTLSQTVVEEFEEPQPEMFPLKTGAYTRTKAAGGEGEDLPADRYITELGFDVWLSRQQPIEELTAASFVKRELEIRATNKEIVTYQIRNLADRERTFKIDHHVRPQWTFVGAEKPLAGIRSCYRFTVVAHKGQIARQSVTEEKSALVKRTLETLEHERAKALLASAQVAEPVKENIRTGLAMLKSLEQTGAALKELRAELSTITDEQARIKANFDKLPPTSDLYKRLIDKFDKQETALEQVQKQLADKTADEKKQQQAYQAFRDKLGVE